MLGLAVAAAVVVSLTVYGLVGLMAHPNSHSTAPCCLAGLGAISNDSSGDSAAYAIVVLGGSPDPMTNFSFSAAFTSPLPIASVCVASTSGQAIGTWVASVWSTNGTSGACSATARTAPASGSILSDGDQLYFYFGSGVLGGVPVGTAFTISASGPYAGADSETLGPLSSDS